MSFSEQGIRLLKWLFRLYFKIQNSRKTIKYNFNNDEPDIINELNNKINNELNDENNDIIVIPLENDKRWPFANCQTEKHGFVRTISNEPIFFR